MNEVHAIGEVNYMKKKKNFEAWEIRQALEDLERAEKVKDNVYNLKFKEGTSLIDVPTHHQIKQDRDNKFLSHIFDAASYLTEFYWTIKKDKEQKNEKFSKTFEQ